MLSEKAIRKDLEITARQIISRKIWPVLDAAIFLGYSRNYMDMLITQRNLVVIRPGGRKNLYAIDILKIFEEINEFSFPELSDKWHADFKIETV